MKIVILDGYTENPGDLSWAPLQKLGPVTVYDRISRGSLAYKQMAEEIYRKLMGGIT